MANVALLERVWSHIQANPESHDQADWATSHNRKNQVPDPAPFSCGTALCFAGTTVALAGYSLRWRWERAVPMVRPAGWRAYECYDPTESDPQPRLIDAVAGELLDLDTEDSGDLFDATNTATDIREILNDIEAREIAKHLGVELHPHQARVLAHALGTQV